MFYLNNIYLAGADTADQSSNSEEEEEEEDVFYLNNIYLAGADTAENPYSIKLTIEGKCLHMDVDTGASISIVSDKIYKQHFAHVPYEACQLKLKTYSGHKLNVMGSANVKVNYENQILVLPIVIVISKGEDMPSLMGRNWLVAIKPNWANIYSRGRNKSPVKPIAFSRPVGAYVPTDEDLQPVLARKVPQWKVEGNVSNDEEMQPVPASRSRKVPQAGPVLPDYVQNQSNPSLEGRRRVWRGPAQSSRFRRESNPSLEGTRRDWRGPAQSHTRSEYCSRPLSRFRRDNFPGPAQSHTRSEYCSRPLSRFRRDNFPLSPQTPRNTSDDNHSPYFMNSSMPIRNNSFGNNSWGRQQGRYYYNSSRGSQYNSNSNGSRKDYSNCGQRNFNAKEGMPLYYYKSMLEDCGHGLSKRKREHCSK